MNQVVFVEMIHGKEEVYHTSPDGVLLQLSQLTLLLETAMAQLELLIQSCFLLPAMIEPYKVAMRRKELVLPDLFQLPCSIRGSFVHLPSDLHGVQLAVLL